MFPVDKYNIMCYNIITFRLKIYHVIKDRNFKANSILFLEYFITKYTNCENINKKRIDKRVAAWYIIQDSKSKTYP